MKILLKTEAVPKTHDMNKEAVWNEVEPATFSTPQKKKMIEKSKRTIETATVNFIHDVRFRNLAQVHKLGVTEHLSKTGDLVSA